MAQRFTIRPASPADFDLLSDWLFKAKLGLAVNRLLYKDWPNETSQRQQYRGAIEGSAKDPHMSYHVALDAEDEPIGFIALTKKVPENKPVEEGGSQKAPDFMNEDVYAEVIRATSAVAKVLDAEAHIDIVYVYVKPSARRKGVATQLIAFVRERANKEGLAIMTCSEPESLPFFVKSGFREVVHEDMDLSKFAAPYTGFGVFRLTGIRWQTGE